MVSLKELKETCMKKGKANIRLKFNRIMGVHIAKLFLYTPITANQVTFLMMFNSLIVFALFSTGKYWYSIIGLILLHFTLYLDAVDGVIARYRKTTSIRGSFLDLTMHSIMSVFIFFGLTLGVFRNTNNFIFLFFGILATIFIYMYGTVQHTKNHVVVIKLMQYAKGEKLEELENKNLEYISPEQGQTPKFIFWKKIIKKLMAILLFHHVPYVLILPIIFNFTQWVLVFYGIGLPLKWLLIFIYEFKMDFKCLEFLFKPYQKRNEK